MKNEILLLKNVISERVLKDIGEKEAYDDAGLLECIDDEIINYPYYVPVQEKLRLKRNIIHSLTGYDILSELLEDDDITDIMINGACDIFYEKNNEMYRYKKVFESVEKLTDVIQHIVSGHNRIVNESVPIVDVRLPDGSRVNVVMPPVAIDGPIVTIRKFPKQDYTLEKLVRLNTLTKDAADFLKNIVKARYNIFISGGTGSGKTTFLNALSNYIPKRERVVTIEDSAELKIQGIENLVRLETRNANFEGRNEVTIRELIKTSLRMRPDRIIVGEVRGAEALDMLQAMNTGHDGSISTGHANSPKDMISRLETLVLIASDIPAGAVRRQIGSALDILIHLGRLSDGTRKVFDISEVIYKENDLQLNQLYRYRNDVKEHKSGMLVRTDNAMEKTYKLYERQMAGCAQKGSVLWAVK